MADEIDQMQDRNEVLDQLRASRKPVNRGPAPIGKCHYCSETVIGQVLFCDSDCRDGWEQELAAKRRNGGAR